MLAIVATTARWGPLRLSHIEKFMGRTQRSNRTSCAADLLERQGVTIKTLANQRNITVELNKQHPHFASLRKFGTSLYRLYIEGLETPKDDHPFPPTPAYYSQNARALTDSHALGGGPAIRALHLLFETGPVPGFLIYTLLGVSRSLDLRLHRFVDAQVLSVNRKGRQLYYSLNTRWPAYYGLCELLESLNAAIPEYAALARVYHQRRLSGKHEWSHYELAKIRRRRTAPSAVTSALLTQI